MHALAGARQNIVGDRRLSGRGRRGFTWRLKSGLQRTNGIFECEAVRFEDFGGYASRVANDCGEHNGAINIAAAAASRGGGCRFEDAPHLRGDAEGILRHAMLLGVLQNAGDDVALDPLAADMARVEHGESVRVVTQGREQMLKRNLRRARASGEFSATSQCRR